MLDILIDMPEDDNLNASNTPLSEVTLTNKKKKKMDE